MRQILAVMVVLTMGTPAFGAFDSIGGTARSKAYGEAVFGSMDGVNSFGYNPATISLLRDIELYGAWDTPYTGFNDGSGINAINVDFVMPFWNAISAEPYVTRRAAIGISVHRNSVIVPDGSGGSSEVYHEGIYSFTYAKDLNDVISRGAKISAGVRFNIFDIGYGDHGDITSNPVLSGLELNKLGFGLDVGITYDFSDTIRLGLSMKNLIAPNLSLWEDGTNNLVSEMRFGANWKIGDLLFMKESEIGFGVVTFGRMAWDNRAPEMTYNLGYRFGFVSGEDMKTPFKGELFTFSLGAIYQSKQTGAHVINLTTGLGFMYTFAKKHRINVDYAIEYGINSGIMQHTAGLTYSILLPRSAFVYTKEEYNEAVRLEMEEAMQESEPEEYVVTFPGDQNKYDVALKKNFDYKKKIHDMSVELSNFGIMLSQLADPGGAIITNAEDAIKEFKYTIRDKGVSMRIKVKVGSTVTYNLQVNKKSSADESAVKATAEYEELLKKIPADIQDLRDLSSQSISLSNELETLKVSAAEDFVKRDKKYLKRAEKMLTMAVIDQEPIPAKAETLVKAWEEILETMVQLNNKY